MDLERSFKPVVCSCAFGWLTASLLGDESGAATMPGRMLTSPQTRHVPVDRSITSGSPCIDSISYTGTIYQWRKYAMNNQEVPGIRESTQPLSGETKYPETVVDEQQEERAGRAEKPSRLEKLERQKSQIEARIKAIQTRENEKERRERTRRLIQIGAIACKYLNCPDDIEPKSFEELLKRVVEVPEVKNILKRS
jgi:hypothetical protein